MTAPAADIITRLSGYAGHDDGMPPCDALTLDGPCTCGYSAVIADAREFLEGESDDE